MKKILLSMALLAVTMMVGAQDFTVTLANAHWGFEATEARRLNNNSAAMTIPANWVAGTDIATYRPYIYPNGNQGTDPDRGYNSRFCLYMNQPNSARRLPIFAMLPAVSDVNYSLLSIEFYGRTFNSTLDVNTSNTVYGDWKVGYLTSLADTAKTNFLAGVHFVSDLNLTANWTKYTIDLSTWPNGVYPVIYIDEMGEHNVRYAYLDDVQYVKKGGNTDPDPEPETVAVNYSLTHCTGDAENPTELTVDDDLVSFVFTPDAGYDWDDVEIYVFLGEEELTEDVEEDNWYMFEPARNTLSVYVTDGYTEELSILIEASKTPLPVITPIPGAATFEEYLSVLPAEGDKYNPYDEDGTHYWQSGDYTFSCTRSYGGGMNDGFYPANYSDTNYVDYHDDYKAITRAGVDGTKAYCSLYYGGAWGGPCSVKCSPRTITGTYVTLAINPYLCIHGGTMMGLAFTDGDYFFLYVQGKKEGVYTGTSASYYLADYRDGKTDEVTTWKWFDLSGLGEVDELEFSIMDSQLGQHIGAYACFDNFGGVAPTPTGCVANIVVAPAQKIVRDGQLLIIREGKTYNVQGAIVR